ncbi:hypothetical protein R1sor_024434 [Riccia sorocarpa]|uniref:Uncharacterized protein n=1 Tax=Riccia sorocarpa TaxID=122646 RepID=A0ABD3GQN7_9MARC
MPTLTFESEADDKTMVMKWKQSALYKAILLFRYENKKGDIRRRSRTSSNSGKSDGKTRRCETDQATDCKKQKTEKVRPQDQSMGDEEDHGKHSGQHRATDILEEVKHSGDVRKARLVLEGRKVSFANCAKNFLKPVNRSDDEDEYMEAIPSSSLPQSCEVQKARHARVAQKASFSDRVKNYLRSIKDSDDEEGYTETIPSQTLDQYEKLRNEDISDEEFTKLLASPPQLLSSHRKKTWQSINHSKKQEDEDSFADLLVNPQCQDSATKKTEGRDIDNSEELQDKDIHDQEPGDGDLLAELQPMYSRRKKTQEVVNPVTDARIAVETTTTSTHFTTTNSVTKSGKATSAISLQKEVPSIFVENEALQRNQRTETPRRTSHRLKSKMYQSVLSTPPSPEMLAAVSD